MGDYTTYDAASLSSLAEDISRRVRLGLHLGLHREQQS